MSRYWTEGTKEAYKLWEKEASRSFLLFLNHLVKNEIQPYYSETIHSIMIEAGDEYNDEGYDKRILDCRFYSEDGTDITEDPSYPMKLQRLNGREYEVDPEDFRYELRSRVLDPLALQIEHFDFNGQLIKLDE